MNRFVITIMFFLMALSTSAHAGWSMGGTFGIVSSDQDDINKLVSRANARNTGGISTSELGNAYEVSAYLAYRFDGTMAAVLFRPSYFFQSEDGTGDDGSYEYGLSAFTFVPTLRFYMLENKMVKFFGQMGIGIGFMNGEIKEGARSVEFSGTDFGYLAGVGAEFCIIGPQHCFSLEGNLRLMGIDRLEVDSSSGAADPGTNSYEIDGKELELDSTDLSASLSGIQGFIGYTYYF